MLHNKMQWHNTNWTYISDHQFRALPNGSSGSGKTKALLNFKKLNDDDNDDADIINQIYLYDKCSNEARY